MVVRCVSPILLAIYKRKIPGMVFVLCSPPPPPAPQHLQYGQESYPRGGYFPGGFDVLTYTNWYTRNIH